MRERTTMKSQSKRLRVGMKKLIASLALASVVWITAVDVASAAPKKKEEPAAAPTKSYTVPYMLVLMLVGVGIMTVCRPTGRLEKVDDKLKKKSDEEEE